MHLKYSADDLKRLCNEEERLATYDKWPIDFISKYTLAKNGFFYKGEDDSAICIFCGVEIGQWEEGDDPVVEHQKFSPNCSMCLNTNAPDASVIRGHDEHGCVIIPRSYKKRNYATDEGRFNSFTDWPISLKQKPKDLAKAGFYYTGKSDKVICFACGLGLNKWEEDDDPWIEHVKWHPECVYVKEKKSEDFINNVLAGTIKIEKHSEEKNLETNRLPINEQLLCSVCKNEERTVVSLPCRHLATCKNCNKQLLNCPICRQKEEESLNVILP